MGSRAYVKSRLATVRKANFKISVKQGFTEVRTTTWSKSWPKIAQKFLDFGVLREIKPRGRNITFVVELNKDQVVQILSGRSQKSKGNTRVIIWLSITGIIIASLFPLGKQMKGISAVRVPNNLGHSCTTLEVSKWLRGDSKTNRMTILETSVIGGITSGTLLCESTKYSYTLGSKEPKRVLKLQKLDT